MIAYTHREAQRHDVSARFTTGTAPLFPTLADRRFGAWCSGLHGLLRHYGDRHLDPVGFQGDPNHKRCTWRGRTSHLDPRANPNDAIDQALKQAKTDHKRVLLDFGADWCPDCQVLAQLFDDPQVKPFLDAHYHVVRIDVGQWNNNLDVANRYGNPIAKGIPAVVILDADSNTITSTAGGELANARTATTNDILTFIQQWAGSK